MQTEVGTPTSIIHVTSRIRLSIFVVAIIVSFAGVLIYMQYFSTPVQTEGVTIRSPHEELTEAQKAQILSNLDSGKQTNAAEEQKIKNTLGTKDSSVSPEDKSTILKNLNSY